MMALDMAKKEQQESLSYDDVQRIALSEYAYMKRISNNSQEIYFDTFEEFKDKCQVMAPGCKIGYADYLAVFIESSPHAKRVLKEYIESPEGNLSRFYFYLSPKASATKQEVMDLMTQVNWTQALESVSKSADIKHQNEQSLEDKMMEKTLVWMKSREGRLWVEESRNKLMPLSLAAARDQLAEIRDPGAPYGYKHPLCDVINSIQVSRREKSLQTIEGDLDCALVQHYDMTLGTRILEAITLDSDIPYVSKQLLTPTIMDSDALRVFGYQGAVGVGCGFLSELTVDAKNLVDTEYKDVNDPSKEKLTAKIKVDIVKKADDLRRFMQNLQGVLGNWSDFNTLEKKLAEIRKTCKGLGIAAEVNQDNWEEVGRETLATCMLLQKGLKRISQLPELGTSYERTFDLDENFLLLCNQEELSDTQDYIVNTLSTDLNRLVKSCVILTTKSEEETSFMPDAELVAAFSPDEQQEGGQNEPVQETLEQKERRIAGKWIPYIRQKSGGGEAGKNSADFIAINVSMMGSLLVSAAIKIFNDKLKTGDAPVVGTEGLTLRIWKGENGKVNVEVKRPLLLKSDSGANTRLSGADCVVGFKIENDKSQNPWNVKISDPKLTIKIAPCLGVSPDKAEQIFSEIEGQVKAEKQKPSHNVMQDEDYRKGISGIHSDLGNIEKETQENTEKKSEQVISSPNNTGTNEQSIRVDLDIIKYESAVLKVKCAAAVLKTNAPEGIRIGGYGGKGVETSGYYINLLKELRDTKSGVALSENYQEIADEELKNAVASLEGRLLLVEMVEVKNELSAMIANIATLKGAGLGLVIEKYNNAQKIFTNGDVAYTGDQLKEYDKLDEQKNKLYKALQENRLEAGADKGKIDAMIKQLNTMYPRPDLIKKLTEAATEYKQVVNELIKHRGITAVQNEAKEQELFQKYDKARQKYIDANDAIQKGHFLAPDLREVDELDKELKVYAKLKDERVVKARGTHDEVDYLINEAIRLAYLANEVASRINSLTAAVDAGMTTEVHTSLKEGLARATVDYSDSMNQYKLAYDQAIQYKDEIGSLKVFSDLQRACDSVGLSATALRSAAMAAALKADSEKGFLSKQRAYSKLRFEGGTEEAVNAAVTVKNAQIAAAREFCLSLANYLDATSKKVGNDTNKKAQQQEQELEKLKNIYLVAAATLDQCTDLVQVNNMLAKIETQTKKLPKWVKEGLSNAEPASKADEVLQKKVKFIEKTEEVKALRLR